jgi:hypothetical protein
MATAALAGTQTTYSSTEQSAVVQRALSALRAGNSAGFAALLDGQAHSRYATQSGAQRLRARIEARVSGAATINFKSEVEGRIQPDTHLVVSHRDYTVEVLSSAQGQGQAQEPVVKFSVRCMGFSFLDSFGGTQQGCRINEISTSGTGAYAESTGGDLEARSLAGTHDKVLREETLSPLAVPAEAGAARL